MHGLFRSLTTISSLRYEKAPGAGRILIGRKNHPGVSEKVLFGSPVNVSSTRSVRKLLELASEELPLHCDPDRIYGLAEKVDCDPDAEDLFEVRILGHHHWELACEGKILMRVLYGLPSLVKLPFNEKKFRIDLPRIFHNIAKSDEERLVGLVRAAEQESHGTILVITEAAETEAARLTQQATPVKPFQLNTAILRNLTPIDGAVVLDPKGVCYAIGAILDGRATNFGDPGRGARYNSAIRYYESAEAPCMLVVVSSDGGVDFVPDPPPAIRRSLIDSAIEKMTGFEQAKQIGRTQYHETLELLDVHRFYLTQEDCNTLNEVLPRLEERIRGEDEAAIWIVRSPFKPHPGMSPDLYYVTE
jgi:hypothetical protein